jgi:hypothetical protein
VLYDYDRARHAARPIPVDKPALAGLANELVKALPGHMKFRAEDMAKQLSHARGFTAKWGFLLGHYSTKNVQGYPVTVPVTVGWKTMDEWSPTRQWIAGGGVNTRYYGPRQHGYKLAMYIDINAGRTPNEILSNLSRVAKEAFSVLIHEVTHLRDVLYYEGEKLEDSEAQTKKYHNSPQELRAFMQQIADEALEYTEKQSKSIGVGPWGITLTSRFVEHALEASLTWNRIKRELEPRNERLILKGVERSLRDEWPRLEKQYPAESIEDDEE